MFLMDTQPPLRTWFTAPPNNKIISDIAYFILGLRGILPIKYVLGLTQISHIKLFGLF